MTDTWEHVRIEYPADRVARLVLARPEAANAQNYQMLSELNEAFDVASRDDDVRVIILAADGKHFSAGHDLRAEPDMSDIDGEAGETVDAEIELGETGETTETGEADASPDGDPPEESTGD